MINEILLISSLLIIFCFVLAAYRYFGNTGLYCMSAVVTVLANIEVLILVVAFGLEQTLGNILFAATFLITDILSETSGKKAANKAVIISTSASLFFVLLSGSWLLYVPSDGDWAMPAIRQIFSNTPRVVFASLSVYAISQIFDVWLYHKWWEFTEKRCGSRKRFLWLRNNGSTLISQLLNTVLFNLLAFAGRPGYDVQLLISIMAGSYMIFIFTSLADTPFLYAARKIHQLQENKKTDK